MHTNLSDLFTLQMSSRFSTRTTRSSVAAVTTGNKATALALRNNENIHHHPLPGKAGIILGQCRCVVTQYGVLYNKISIVILYSDNDDVTQRVSAVTQYSWGSQNSFLL